MLIPTQVQRQFDFLCNRAKEIYPVFVVPELVIKTAGGTAGWARWRSNPQRWIVDLNRVYIISHFEDMLSDTLPHEVAHILAWQRYGMKIAPHGGEWYAMYGALTGRVPQRLHEYGSVQTAAKRKEEMLAGVAERLLKELEGQ